MVKGKEQVSKVHLFQGVFEHSNRWNKILMHAAYYNVNDIVKQAAREALAAAVPTHPILSNNINVFNQVSLRILPLATATFFFVPNTVVLFYLHSACQSKSWRRTPNYLLSAQIPANFSTRNILHTNNLAPSTTTLSARSLQAPELTIEQWLGPNQPLDDHSTSNLRDGVLLSSPLMNHPKSRLGLLVATKDMQEATWKYVPLAPLVSLLIGLLILEVSAYRLFWRYGNSIVIMMDGTFCITLQKTLLFVVMAT
ncbi:hypothetical protein BDK51DRAFT_36759 [Blyttiomyces helicus]|uniref:Uncharacterized protein n=1 Tax=Blyttiomyces helicus TaxID=388810 RepID=A0A4V1ISM3_9FUNG|nr:hypothetical protein BDK51DRAFT_36759 [Blyttiomyces helicus]|eukprot:RKO94057.1 hypothetical protein BDK51DRAFT_36759 [Blyttiomyces helicus]